MVVDVGPKFYLGTIHTPSPRGQGHVLRNFILKCCVKVFKSSASSGVLSSDRPC